MTRTSTPLSLTVYCASSKRLPQLYLDVAAELGRLIAQRGHTLVYGGGNIGLMDARAKAALAHEGKVTGVILSDFIDRGYANSGHEMHSVDDMRARKRGLDEFGDAYIALPGGFGTLEEILESFPSSNSVFTTSPSSSSTPTITLPVCSGSSTGDS